MNRSVFAVCVATALLSFFFCGVYIVLNPPVRPSEQEIEAVARDLIEARELIEGKTVESYYADQYFVRLRFDDGTSLTVSLSGESLIVGWQTPYKGN